MSWKVMAMFHVMFQCVLIVCLFVWVEYYQMNNLLIICDSTALKHLEEFQQSLALVVMENYEMGTLHQ